MYIQRYESGGWKSFGGPKATGGSGSVDFVWTGANGYTSYANTKWALHQQYALHAVFNGDADYDKSTSGDYWLAAY